MGILEDATAILLFLGDYGEGSKKGHGTMEGSDFMGPLQLTPERVNDAVSTLEENGYVEVARYLGTRPFSFKYVALTTRGRREAERLVVRKAPTEAAPTSTASPSVPRVRRSPDPVGSPYGFEDADWESVERDRRDGHQLIVVLGHQWNSTHFDTAALKANVEATLQRALAEALTKLPDHPDAKLDYRPLKGGYGGHVFNEIARDIIGADIAIFDTSDMNPNVMLEMGVALTWGIRVLPIREASSEKPPSDVSGQTWTTYTDSGASWTDPEHHEKLTAMVLRAVRKKSAATDR
jgi:hypothetical protein